MVYPARRGYTENLANRLSGRLPIICSTLISGYNIHEDSMVSRSRCVLVRSEYVPVSVLNKGHVGIAQGFKFFSPGPVRQPAILLT